MKRFLFLLVFVFFFCLNVHGQLAVIDATLNSLISGTWLEQAGYYASLVGDSANQLLTLKSQLENAGKQLEAQMQNLASLKDVENLNDFKDWYNRQLHLEHMTEDVFKGMNVNIGKKNYSLWDIDGIADGLNDTYIAYWDKEFTEEQRRELWIGLGLSPANYAYVQPYRQKGREVAREMFAMSEIQNRKNQEYYKELVKDLHKMKDDVSKPLNEQMGAKMIAQIQAASLFRIENQLMDTSSMLAKYLEMQGIKEALDRPLNQTPEFTKFPDDPYNLGNK